MTEKTHLAHLILPEQGYLPDNSLDPAIDGFVITSMNDLQDPIVTINLTLPGDFTISNGISPTSGRSCSGIIQNGFWIIHLHATEQVPDSGIARQASMDLDSRQIVVGDSDNTAISAVNLVLFEDDPTLNAAIKKGTHVIPHGSIGAMSLKINIL